MQRLLSTSVFLLFCLAPIFAQNISDEAVKKGIESFYMADFEEAMNTLQNAIINDVLSDEEQFYAHIFVGFCHIRQGSDPATVNVYFKRAITISPHTELDPMKIPPDLYDAFTGVKNALLGAVVVMSDPLDATVLVIEPSSNAIERKITPAAFHNLLEGSYQVLVSKNGYETFAGSVQVLPGASDTLNVILLQKKNFFRGISRRNLRCLFGF